jgi:hypothetical protein
MRKKKESSTVRSNESIMEIKLAFFGATNNLYLLEEILVKNNYVKLYQYNNYLCQIAFCIELGLKSIIIDKKNVEKIHDLKKLFSMTPIEFQNNFKSLYNDERAFNSYMSSSKNAFVYLRYMQLKCLRMYLDENLINPDSSINIVKSMDQLNVKFIQNFLCEILKYHHVTRGEIISRLPDVKLMGIDAIINEYNEIAKNI